MAEMPGQGWGPGRAGDDGQNNTAALAVVKPKDVTPAIQKLRIEIDTLERIALAAMVADPEGVRTYGLRPSNFTNPSHAAVCKEVGEVEAEGSATGPASINALDRRLRAVPAYVAAGGLKWLAGLVDGFVGDPVHWCDRLREARARLDAHDQLSSLAEKVADLTSEPGAVVSTVETLATQLREAASASAGLELVDSTELDSKEPTNREFIVEGTLPRRVVVMLAGDGGVGKSMLALQMGEAIRRGEPFLGRETTAGSVLVFSCEDDADELHRRLHRIRSSLGPAHNPPGRLLLAPRVGLTNALVTFDARGLPEQTEAFRALERATLNHRVSLVIVDTVAQVFAGSENDRSQVTAFVNALAGLAMRANACILLLAHPPKADGVEYSGSTAWPGTVRARLFLRRQVGDDGITRYFLKLGKANYAPEFEDELVRDTHGVMWSAERLPPSLANKIDAYADLADAKRVFLAALDAMTRQGRALSHAPRAQNYAPKAIAAAGLDQGQGRVRLARAMEALFADGLIKAGCVVGKGTDRKPIYGIARSGTGAPE
ncbi:AAA family ATPase [Geminicoccus flavidas]|uniref:AAA family ATPase n=1 Tax=Geminicoccus flavidas TaxID=2506407 RepID=UPI00135937FC|nr:AAA family ATPase [Geminicoccus flavidas]